MKVNRGGFTIIESMIFLAISGMMFASAVIMLGGRQRSTQFSQGLRQFESTINDVINDTSTGTFVQKPDVLCSSTGGVVTFSESIGTVTGQNNNCIFLGKMIHFGDSLNSNELNIITVVGANNSGRSFTDSSPTAFYNTSSPVFDTKEEYSLEWGAEVGNTYYLDSTGPRYLRGLGILYSDFGGASTADSFLSGSANVSLYAAEAEDNVRVRDVDESRIGYEAFRGHIRNLTNDTDFIPLDTTAYVCVSNGDQRAVVEIGGTTGSLTAVVNYDPPAECDNA